MPHSSDPQRPRRPLARRFALPLLTGALVVAGSIAASDTTDPQQVALATPVPAALSQGGHTAPPATATPPAPDVPPATAVLPDGRQPSVTGDRRMDAIVFGLASVAVDSEANVIRINELEDRIAQLEQRIKALEAKLPGR